MMRRCSLILALAALLPASALAQGGGRCGELSPTEMEEARALFIAGSAAVEAGRWSDAVASYERAYQLSCAPSALYNLAMAYRALGRHRDARDAFDRLMALHPDLNADLRVNAQQFRREEASRVAVLELVGIDPDARTEISFDGRAVPDEGQRPVVVETDAGSHSLVARLPEHQPFVWEGALSDGQRETVQAVFRPIPTGDDTVAVVLLVVGAVALVGGGVALAVLLQEDAQLQPLSPFVVEL